MSYNQFLGLGFGSSGGTSGGGRGPKGDPGSFVWSFGNPPNIDEHLRLTDDDVTLYKSIRPSHDQVVDVGESDYNLRNVYTKNLHTDNVLYSGGAVNVSYDSEGVHRIRVGEDYTVLGVTTLRENPDKIDPKYLDFTGLRFVAVISGDQNLANLLVERPMLQPGDYFVVNSDGNFNYELFDEIDNVAIRGDILVFTLERFFKVPFRIPNNSVGTYHLEDNSITSQKLLPDVIQTQHLQDESVVSTKLASDLTVKNFDVADNFVSHSFCSNEKILSDDPMSNKTFGITFADRGEVKLGTWRIVSSIENMTFQIWNGTKWVQKFELR